MFTKVIFVSLIAFLLFLATDKILNQMKVVPYEPFVSGSCPTTMIKKGGKIMLYNPDMAKIPGVNPLIMDSLKDYKEYLKWQRANGLNCPILHLEKEYDAQGVEKYEVKRSFAGHDQDIHVGTMNHNLPVIQKEPKLSLLLDAQAQNNIKFNQNMFYSYDPYNQNIGKITKIDEVPSPSTC